MKKIINIVLFVATLWVAMSFTVKPEDETLVIQFDHYVGSRSLKFDTVIYKNDLGQSFTVTKLKYYISNIHLRKVDGSEIVVYEYFLINEEEPESKKITLSHVPPGRYSGIEFTIGVDSLHNCSGAQSGALDPVNGMFWAWNSGYIFLKMEGRSPASASPGNIFEYHIGGYRQPSNCIRSVALTFNEPLVVPGNKTLYIKTDASEILKTPITIDFSKLSSVTDFHNATMMADNYKDMFSIEAIK